MKKLILLLLVFAFAGIPSVLAGTVQIMDKDELKSMLDSSELIIVDVRRGKDWNSSEYKIKGAVRLPSDEVESAMDDYPKESTLVFYCA